MEGFTLTLDLNIQQIIEPIALRAYEDSRVLPPELAHRVLRSNNAICLTARRRVDFPQPDHIQTSAGGVNQGKPPAQE